MKYIALFSLLLIIAGCKKPGGKYCPVMEIRRGTNNADLSPVSGIGPIMDTLKKHPELEPYRAVGNYGTFDPSFYSASLNCNVYYKNVIIFNLGYGLSWNTSTGISVSSPTLFPLNIEISTGPSIDAGRANEIAENAINFKACQNSQLGISYSGTMSNPDYKLIWRITGAESGYPLVDIDAHTGNIYRIDDGIRH